MMISFTFILVFISLASGKTYERCELARELKYIHGALDNQVATWVCIARHESEYNTSAVGSKNGDGSSDHGIFQISDNFWCSPPGKGWACGLTCAMLEDDDIADDFVCANKIYKEHKYLQGDGFKAWTVYENFCMGSKAQKYIEGCFTANDLATPYSKKKPTTKKIYPWLIPQTSTELTKSDTKIPSTCSNRVDIPTKVNPEFTIIPLLTDSRISNNIHTTKQHISITPTSTPFFQIFPTSTNRFSSFQTQTEQKISLSTQPLTQKSVELQHNQKRESVFVINGRSWL